MGVEERKALIKQIEEKRGTRLLCCLTSDRENAQGLIAKDFLHRFFLHIRKMENLQKLDVLLFTLGGDTLAAYALSRFVRQYTQSIGVLVPHMCLSSGTLFALGADEIVMTRLGTLSAIDPSINGPLNPTSDIGPQIGSLMGQKNGVPVGVESVSGFQKLIDDEWELDEQGRSRAFSLLADKVSPILLGDLQRSKDQIVRLGVSLMKLHVKPMESERIQQIVTKLASGLGSHDYMLVADEARAEGLPVPENDLTLEDLLHNLYEDFAREMLLGKPFDPLEGLGQKQMQQVTMVSKLVMIESLERSDVWERELLFIPPGQLQVRRNHWKD